MSRKDRLVSLLRLKEIREQQAQAEKARRAAREREAIAEVRERRATAQAAADLPHHSMPPTMLRALAVAGWASAENLQLAEVEWERTVRRREESEQRLRDAAVGRRSVQKLAERRQAEAIAARREAAGRALDELYLLSLGRNP